MAGRVIVVLAALLALGAAPAHAAFLEYGGFQGGQTQGIALGQDGNLWVGEPGSNSVVRMDRAGNVLHRYPVGGDARDVTTGPGGRVWVAVDFDPAGGKLVWFDALAATPTAHDISTSGVSTCGPVAVENGGNGAMYMTLPQMSCPDPNRLGYVNADGTGSPTVINDAGRALDIAVTGGKLFAPDFDGQLVRRRALTAALTPEAVINIPGGGNPEGITGDGAGGVWTTLYTAGKVARFAVNAVDTTEAAVLTPSGGTLANPFGIVAGPDGAMYVAGFGSANVVRIDRATNAFTFFPAPSGAKPWRLVTGTDDDFWVSDLNNGRVLRLLRGAPRIGSLNLRADSPTSAVLDIEVDPRGAASQLVVDYGPTSAYGTTTAPVSIPAGAGFVSQRVTLGGLSPTTEYHARARVTNADGESATQDMAFTTPPAPGDPPGTVPRPPEVVPPVTPPLSALRARVVARSRAFRRFTRITRLRVERLTGGETIVVRCSGRGCPFRRRTVRVTRAGTVNLQRAFRRRKLRRGARVRVHVTKPGTIGRAATITIRSRRTARVRRGCLAAGTTTAAPCA